MSELHRLQRIIKSVIPHTPRSADRRYDFGDARMMINDLGMELSPKTLAHLVNSDTVLDDFIHSVYELEHKLGRKSTTDLSIFDPELQPKVYEEGKRVLFTIVIKGEEWIFAEYEIPA